MLLVAVAALFAIAGAQANPPEQSGFFELDKNAQNNVSTKFLGSLGGNINASVTSFTVCQASSTNPSPLPITIQVDAEQMTVGAIAAAGGGGCSGAFKRTYSSVTRGANSTTAASHGASGVSGYVTQVINATVAGDDWDQVYAAVQANGHPTPDDPNPCSGTAWTGGSAIKACDWEHDPDGQTVFNTGGSKDDHDISDWRHTDQSVPDADDITDGFVAKYVDSALGAHEFLFFGADRTAVNGAKDMGFWFFKSPISLNDDGTFSGVHTVGDILLLGTFTQGGAATTIRVFTWAGPGQGDTNDVLDSGGQFDDCVGGVNTTNGCNTVNNSTVKSPWDYQSKISGTPANTLYAGALMEGGIDLTSLGLEGCFSNFLVETRSSPEVGAQLKDFLLGSFEVCQSSLKTTPKDGSGNDIPSGGLSIGTGSVTARDSADLQVTGASTWSGTFKYFICGPVSSDTCDPSVGLQIGATQNVDQDNPPVLSDAATLTSAGRYCWAGVFTSATEGVDDQTDKSAGECFNVNPVTPGLDTQAVASPVNLGQPVQDNATLGPPGTSTATQPGTDGPNATYPSINATNGAPAGGHITFTLFGPDNCTTVTSNGTGTNPQDVAVSGNGTYGPVSYTPGATGTYHWVAEYVPATGDPNNLGSTHNATCTDSDEDVVVQQFPTTTTTRQFVYPQDKAKVTVGGGGDLAGSLRFRLYDTLANCNADGGTAATGMLYEEADALHPIAGASPQFATTNNTTVRITTNTTVYWNVRYSSTKDSQPGSSSACEESTAVTYVGNDATIAIP
jgi:hypothetical protein